MKQLIFGTAIMFAALAGWAQGEVIYQENFDRIQTPSDLSSLGWQVVSQPGHSAYTVKDGKLYIKITPHKFQDGYAEITIPVCRKGSIDFDVMTDPESTGERGTGLFLDIYNISTFWHDYCGDWRVYFPEPTARRMPGFAVEPVGHKSIAACKRSTWNHYRIYFDTDRDRVEFYINNMDDPALIKADTPVLGRAEYQGGKLRIGSMGICAGPYLAAIDNIVVRRLDGENTATAKTNKDLLLLFRGMASGHYNIGNALVNDNIKQEFIRNYDLVSWRASNYPVNPFKYKNLPGAESLESAAAIILIDAPLGPDNVLPDFVLKDIVQRVEDGARLVIFGGLFTLDKGEFKDSLLEPLLPVELNSPWQTKGSSEPLTIEPEAPQFKKLDWSGKPCVYYYHDLALKKDAAVLLRAGGKPLLVSKKYGKGEVVVFLGTVCGPATEQPPAFWKWKNWPELAAMICRNK